MRLRNAALLLASLIVAQLLIAAALVIWGVGFLVVFVVVLPLLVGAFTVTSVYSMIVGAPFVPMDHERIEAMLDLAGIKAGEILADLGSGDGRIVVAAARRGAQAEGWEVSPFLWAYSTWNIRRLGLQDRAKIHLGSYWPASVARFNVVTLFLLPPHMERMEKKLRSELQRGSRVVSYAFTFPTWSPDTSNGKLRRYLVS